MKSKPILFSTPMVQAILDGRKTQTRRLKGLEQINIYPDLYTGVKIGIGTENYVSFANSLREIIKIKCPFGQVGDVLWVRETFFKNPNSGIFVYKASNEMRIIDTDFVKWKPSIFMPKDACRIWLEITAISVERLNDISDEDAKNEGIKLSEHSSENVDLWHRYDDQSYSFLPQLSFRTLWQSINGEESWNDNPWVWVIEFKLIEKPI